MKRKLFYLALLINIFIFSQKEITGIVKDSESGDPIPGVTVALDGTSTGTITAVDGKFSIKVSNEVKSINFSFVGYLSQKVEIGDKTDLQVILQTDSKNIEEVVVTALGIKKEKKSLGYSVKELKSSDFSDVKESNLVNSLAGKVAGLQVTNSQGSFGSSRIVIRGENSIAGNNQPLFVIDGIPVDNSQLGGTSVNAGGTATRDYANAISDINSEDIESISILKGPNAAALYGARAANGVILLKTKTGKGSKNLGVNFYVGTTWESVLELPKYQNLFGQGSAGQFSYVDGAGGGINDGTDESWGPRLDAGLKIRQFDSKGQATDWVSHPNNVRDYFETGYTTTTGIAISAEKENYNYRFSYNKSYQKGIYPNTNLDKNSFGINTGYKILPNLELTSNINYYTTNSDNLPGTYGKRATSTMLQFTWFGRQVDINSLKNDRRVNWNNAYYSNPYFIAYNNTASQRKDRIVGNVNLKYTFLNDFSLNYKAGTDFYLDKRKLKIAFGTSGTPYGSYEEDAYTVNETNHEFTLNYNKKIWNDFSISILGGGNISIKSYEQNDQKANGLAVAGTYTLTNSRNALVSSNYFSQKRINSLFTSAQIGFRNYAFLNFTGRNDWSSTLPKDNNSYFYPSINASLVLSDALNIKNDILSYLKLRGGWSRVGNDTDPYQLLNTYTFSTSTFQNNPIITLTDKSKNNELKPEKTDSYEIGTEIGVLKNRVKLDVSLYNTDTYNQIISEDVSASTGHTSKLKNAGQINNKGIEIQLSATPININGFRWETTINYAKNKSELIKIDDEGKLKNFTIGSSGITLLAEVGKPYGTIVGTAYERNSKGDIIIDADGLPKVSSTTKSLGSFQADWTGSISNSFSYKGISLSFLIDGKIGGKIFSGTNQTGTYTGVLESTLPGRDAEHGGLTYTKNGTTYSDGKIFNGVLSDGVTKNTTIISSEDYYHTAYDVAEAFVYDATYIKLRELKLSYSIPSALLKKVKINSATFSLIGRNLWIIHKNAPNIDPETAYGSGNFQGYESLQLPTTRSYGFTLNINL